MCLLTEPAPDKELSKLLRHIQEEAAQSPDAPPSEETLFRLLQTHAAQLEALLPITTLIKTNADMASAIWEHTALFAALCTRAKYRAGLVWADLADLADAEDPHEGHWECVRAALHAEDATDCLSDDEIATRTRDRLARRLTVTLKDLQQFVGMDGEPPADEEAAKETIPTDDGPILKWDERRAKWFETRWKQIPEAAPLATEIRQKARGRWEVFERQLTIDGVANAGKLWDGWYFSPQDGSGATNIDIASLVARVLWRTEISDFFERAKQRKAARQPALPFTSLERIVSLQRRGMRVNDTRVMDSAGTVVADLGPALSVDIPAIDITMLDALVARGVDLLGTIAAHKLLWWVIEESANQWGLMDAPIGVPRLEIIGGWGALCRAIGIPNKSQNRESVKSIALAMARVWVVVPGCSISTGLITVAYNDTCRGPGNPTWVRISPGDAIAPGTAAGATVWRTRRLVPMHAQPPMVGRSREHGPLYTFGLATLGEIRANVGQLLTDDGVLITEDRLQQFAKPLSLSRKLVRQAMDRWTRDDDGPAWLELQGRDRYHLGKTYEGARGMLERAARATQPKRRKRNSWFVRQYRKVDL